MASQAPSSSPPLFKTMLLFLLPIVALTAVITLFLVGGASTRLQSALPVEDLTVERYELERGHVILHVRNTGPAPLMISQVIVNDAVWPFVANPAGTIPRLGQATVQLDYMWSRGESYIVRILTANAIPFELQIPVAAETAQPSAATFVGFTLIGLYVGIIPVFLGILWFPALRRMGRNTLNFLMAATVGLLLFLGVDTLFEAREASLVLPNAFQGVGVIAIGVVATALLLDAISNRQQVASGTDSQRRIVIASIIAVGIGFHNLGEGLAIGAAYNIGEFALGKFLVVGFIIQNITEGLGIVAPVLRERPGLKRFLLWGLIAGGPAIIGAWIGGYAPSPLLAVVFLAIGAGAILQVIYEIWKLLRRDSAGQAFPPLVYSGVVAGMLLLWVTGLLIK